MCPQFDVFFGSSRTYYAQIYSSHDLEIVRTQTDDLLDGDVTMDCKQRSTAKFN